MHKNTLNAIGSIIAGLVVATLLVLAGLAFYNTADNNRQKVQTITTECIEAGHQGAVELGTSGFSCVG